MSKKFLQYLQQRARGDVKCFEIKNATEESADVFIYDFIGEGFFGGGVTASDIVLQIKNLKTRRINVRINSPGGDVFDGFAIYEAFNRHDAEVTVYVDSIAASIASVIAMAGRRIVIAETGRFMIHDPWSIVLGTAGEMRKQADVLDQLTETIIGVYQARTGLSREALAAMMHEETWIPAEEAVEKKFADEKGPAMRAAAASFDLSLFGYAKAPAGVQGGTTAGAEGNATGAAAPSPAPSPGASAPAASAANNLKTPRSLLERRQALLEKTTK